MHPSMRHVAAVRKQLGIRTIFNLLGPLCNPADAAFQLLGVGQPPVRNLIAEVLQQLGTQRSVVVCGEDGLDEVTLGGPTHCSVAEPGGCREFPLGAERFWDLAGHRSHFVVGSVTPPKRGDHPSDSGRRTRTAPRNRHPERGCRPVDGRAFLPNCRGAQRRCGSRFRTAPPPKRSIDWHESVTCNLTAQQHAGDARHDCSRADATGPVLSAARPALLPNGGKDALQLPSSTLPGCRPHSARAETSPRRAAGSRCHRRDLSAAGRLQLGVPHAEIRSAQPP